MEGAGAGSGEHHGYHFQESELPRHAKDKFESMSNKELKTWLQDKGADTASAVEREDLLEMARKMESGAGDK
ncbi:peptidylprolyl isomerase [Chlorella sorokiniana]|jgi:hypothetical protein|uniref:Peptidylprolyl isomerase n=1 Tax=Chlorella sorokiniana TaxID=3076 RepID=A0A2P6TKX0_CHLSO|nr:peptidylprolyl isomerase [Chlorella sorokiniana]|eukprot:PRW44915.1 peptidylprolyl isomerase [Chlorella sorokiniana]